MHLFSVFIFDLRSKVRAQKKKKLQNKKNHNFTSQIFFLFLTHMFGYIYWH